MPGELTIEVELHLRMVAELIHELALHPRVVTELIHEVGDLNHEERELIHGQVLHPRLSCYHENTMTEIKGASRDRDAVCLGLIFKRTRMQRGWTLQQVGKAIGVHPTHVGVIERGGNLPSVKTILSFAQLFGLDPGDILREMLEDRRKFQRQ